MPVIARLSSRFYEVVGEDVTQQLVDWLNAVEEELTWRASLRLQREVPPARFEVRKAPSFSALARVHPSGAQPPALKDFADLRLELRRLRSDLVWWMFLFSVGTLLGTAGLLIALRGT